MSKDNLNHKPAGSPEGGQFVSKNSGIKAPTAAYNYRSAAYDYRSTAYDYRLPKSQDIVVEEDSEEIESNGFSRHDNSSQTSSNGSGSNGGNAVY